jgi:DNA-binding transcriptional MerR regulator
MPSLLFQIVSWPTLGISLVVFGFAPGAVLRLIILAFPRDDPRRRELRGELYAVPWISRPFWVIQQLEVGLFEGLPGRFTRWRGHGRGAHDQGGAIEHAGEQGLLFGDEVLAIHSEDVGYRGPTACAAAGITYRQLDHWARTGLVEPSVRAAHGSGSQRLYSFRDICVLKVIKRLLDAGISLQQIRTAVEHLRVYGADDLARLTLMSDGDSLVECTTTDEVVDLLTGGRGIFGIALGRIWREVDGTLMELPYEPDDGAA